MQPFIGRVQYYYRLELPQGDGTRICRLAVCQHSPLSRPCMSSS